MTHPEPLVVARLMADHEGTAGVWKHEIEEVGLDHAVVTMKILPDMTNGLGVAHGGIVFALADTALAYAACAGDELHVTANAAINFLAAAKLGDVLVARATVLARVGRFAAIDVRITAPDGEVIATGHGVSRRIGGSVVALLNEA
jgi:acyl-CoA thioesterase